MHVPGLDPEPPTLIDLEQPLPGERIRGDTPRFFEYHRYPAFSKHWLKGRTIIFGIILLGFTLMAFAGNQMILKDLALSVKLALLFFFGFLSFSMLGPALATAIRYRRWSLRSERALVLTALLFGLVMSGLIDTQISGHIQQETEHKLRAAGIIDSKPVEAIKKQEKTPLVMALKLLSAAMIYGLFGGGIAVFTYWGEPRRRKAHAEAEVMRANKAESEQRLSLLQSQVEPHFLFNTLAAVRASLRTQPADAEAMLDALIDYLRATIPKIRSQGQHDSTLGDQLDLVGHYLRLMQLRMGHRLSVQIAADATLRQRAFPPLLLLSLVENAIKHGLEPKPGPVSVRVVASETATSLVIEVIDDGVGLGATAMGSGVGLQNLREHLKARFGDRAGFELVSSASGGTVARMHLPRES
ncbi:sensor histidine kinase [Ahniella affigens]|uniref:histidine kinase n=1 Tax=Ahniella affigens TaxID=2021234 RepID=A0A2P1PXI1_9GAMM|nr:histidine kinase [Ahniella affigens]AVP99514.1 sensor histidine kinase [Ahniella affigens]